MTKALEGTEASQQTPSTIRLEKPEGTDTVYTNSHMCSVEFSHVALEDPWLRGWPLIIINSSHNNNWIEFRRFIVLKRQWRVRCIFHKNLNQNSGVRWIFISFLLMTLTNLRNHLLIVEKHVPSYERCSLYFLRMVKDGRKKVATINNNLFAGAQNWGNHFTWNSKVCRVECQKCGV